MSLNGNTAAEAKSSNYHHKSTTVLMEASTLLLERFHKLLAQLSFTS